MSIRRVWLLFLSIFLFFLLNGFVSHPVYPPTVELKAEQLLSGEPFIYRIEPEPRGGKAYKLIYLVPVPIDVFWRFKTDFKGDFLRTNKYVKRQRVIRQEQNVVIIENRLSNRPDVTFRWRNTLQPKKYRLDYVLENPEQCGQRFHYGHFQLEPFEQYTKVSHAAYFDFLGVSLWVNYPWEGGMIKFLEYIARWERNTILQFKDNYGVKTKK